MKYQLIVNIFYDVKRQPTIMNTFTIESDNKFDLEIKASLIEAHYLVKDDYYVNTVIV